MANKDWDLYPGNEAGAFDHLDQQENETGFTELQIAKQDVYLLEAKVQRLENDLANAMELAYQTDKKNKQLVDMGVRLVGCLALARPYIVENEFKKVIEDTTEAAQELFYPLI